MHACMLSCFSSVQLFMILWTVAHRLLCPWDSPDKNTGVGCSVPSSFIFNLDIHYLNALPSISHPIS